MKRVLVIGGSKERSLGKAIADKLRDEGHKVVCRSRKSDPPLDLTWDKMAIKKAVRRAIRDDLGGMLDLLIVSSGRAIEYGPDPKEEDVRKMLATNTEGPLYVYSSVLPFLSVSQGTALFVGSTVSRPPGQKKLGVYAMSKGAIDSWAQCEYRRARKAGIRLQVVRIGWCNTGVLDGYPPCEMEKIRQAAGGRIPEPEEGAEAILGELDKDPEPVSEVLTGEI